MTHVWIQDGQFIVCTWCGRSMKEWNLPDECEDRKEYQ